MSLQTITRAGAMPVFLAATLAALGPVRGWKVGAKNLAMEPTAAPLPASGLLATGCSLQGPAWQVRGIELEVAVRLGRDLAPSDAHLGAHELQQAIDAVLPVIEVVETRLADWRQADPLAQLADLQSHGALVLGAGVCIAYSKWLKRVPALDILAMGVWGFAMPLCGAPLDRTLGLLLALQLGLMSAVFESIQVIRDYEADRDAGVRTTAVVLGKAKTLWLARALMMVSAAYAALVLHPIAGLIAASALVVRLREPAVDAYWTRIKLISGVASAEDTV